MHEDIATPAVGRRLLQIPAPSRGIFHPREEAYIVAPANLCDGLLHKRIVGERPAKVIGAHYRRLAVRHGTKKAAVALAHTIVVIAYHVLTRKEPYRDLGVNYFNEHDRHAVERRLIRRLEKLGLKGRSDPA
jgi:hypothetical protein